MFKVCLAISVSLLLSACAPITLHQPTLYSLNPAPVKTKVHHGRKTLLVLRTQAAPELDDEKMMYVTKRHEVGYYADHEWAAQPAKMLQFLITNAIQKSGYYKAVVTPPFTGESEVKLATRLVKLQQNFLTKPSRVQMLVMAQLINSNNNKVIAEKGFQANIPAPVDTPYGGVIAANKATSLILRQLVAFVKLGT